MVLDDVRAFIQRPSSYGCASPEPQFPSKQTPFNAQPTIAVKNEPLQPVEKPASSSSQSKGKASLPTYSSPSGSARSFWWVVLRGTKPGIYDDLSLVREAAATHMLVRVEHLGTQEKAELLWGKALAVGQVALLPSF
ncbi:hypothetical protein VNI00_015537 [Paramarasmius palmivorus]|uniref:Uncharacterized protein n=1 Tax=Paramarasmius palmivorus TaxID=297713 RepID=A0AAW0BKL5_9AGAR